MAAWRQSRRKADSGQRAWSFTQGEKIAWLARLTGRAPSPMFGSTRRSIIAPTCAWAAQVVADTEALARMLAGSPL